MLKPENFKLIGLLLVTAWSLVACGEEDSVGKLEVGEETPVMTFVNMRNQYTQDEYVRVKVEAEIQHKLQNGNDTYPKGLYVEFFDSLGTMTTTLVADSGVYLSEDQSYRVVGNVEVINIQEDQKLETTVLNWNRLDAEIYTDTLTPVKITTPKEIINGNGLRANQDFSEYEITGGISGIFTIDDPAAAGKRPPSAKPTENGPPTQQRIPKQVSPAQKMKKRKQ